MTMTAIIAKEKGLTDEQRKKLGPVPNFQIKTLPSGIAPAQVRQQILNGLRNFGQVSDEIKSQWIKFAQTFDDPGIKSALEKLASEIKKLKLD